MQQPDAVEARRLLLQGVLKCLFTGVPVASVLAGLLLALDGPGARPRTEHHALLLAAVTGATLASSSATGDAAWAAETKSRGESGAVAAGVGSFVIGVGLGLVNSTTLIAIQASDRNGKLVGAVLVNEHDELMLVSTGGVLIRTQVSQIREMGRSTLGVTLISLDAGDRLPHRVTVERAGL